MALTEQKRPFTPERIAKEVDQHGRLAYRMAYAILGNPQEAEDAVGDTVLTLLSANPPIPVVAGREKAYFVTSVMNRARDQYRKNKRGIRDGIHAYEHRMQDPSGQRHERQVERRSRIGFGIGHLNDLPTAERHALAGHILHQLSGEEEREDQPSRTATSRAQSRLRKWEEASPKKRPRP